MENGLATWDLLYTPSHRQDSTYHGFFNTSCEALAGMRNNFYIPIGYEHILN